MSIVIIDDEEEVKHQNQFLSGEAEFNYDILGDNDEEEDEEDDVLKETGLKLPSSSQQASSLFDFNCNDEREETRVVDSVLVTPRSAVPVKRAAAVANSEVIDLCSPSPFPTSSTEVGATQALKGRSVFRSNNENRVNIAVVSSPVVTDAIADITRDDSALGKSKDVATPPPSSQPTAQSQVGRKKKAAQAESTTSKKVSSDSSGKVKKKKKKPTAEEALAEVTVLVDEQLKDSSFFMELVAALQHGCRVRFRPANVSSSISWSRESDQVGDATGQEAAAESARLCPFLVVVVSAQEFAEWARSDELLVQLTAQRSVISQSTRVLWLVEAMHSFLAAESRLVSQRLNQSIRQQQRQATAAAAAPVASSAAFSPGNPAPRALPATFDYVFECVKLQFHGCQVLDVATAADGARLLAELTRAIAQQPYKQQVQFASFCADGVRARKVASIGVWANQLMLVRGVSRQVAEAIVAVFPTMKSLLEHYYDPALSREEKEKLLHSRVAVSRLSRNQPINEPLSRSIYEVFTCTDGDALVPWQQRRKK